LFLSKAGSRSGNCKTLTFNNKERRGYIDAHGEGGQVDETGPPGKFSKTC
jgi:hypothetical protein